MKNAKIRTRLLICFGVTILMTLVVAYAGMGTLSSTRKGALSVESLHLAEIAVAVVTFVDGQLDRRFSDTGKHMIVFCDNAMKRISQNVSAVIDFYVYVKISFCNISRNLRLVLNIFHNFLKIIHQFAKFIVANFFQHYVCTALMGAEQVSDASQSLAQGSTQQASAIQQVTASIAEIAERTKRNAEEANQANASVHSMLLQCY